jgi:hypothetical protein
VLLQPDVRQESIILTPDTAEEARQEQLHFSVLDLGADVERKFYKGQEVFPDKGRVNPMNIEGRDLAFVDHQFIYGVIGNAEG